ncbi:hypothetical protein S83_012243, partial [Arachis hypogaea]
YMIGVKVNFLRLCCLLRLNLLFDFASCFICPSILLQLPFWRFSVSYYFRMLGRNLRMSLHVMVTASFIGALVYAIAAVFVVDFSEFIRFYDFVFFMCRENGQKNI